MQNPYPPKVDESLLKSRIEYLSEFGLYDEREREMNKDLRWCSGIVERVSDGTWINTGNRRQCYKEVEAAEVFWDTMPEFNMEASRSIKPFNSRLWNKNENESWRIDLGDISYGSATYYNNSVVDTVFIY